MSSGKPEVSVIMSVHNGDKNYLMLAIESILSQSFENFEFIIIDDASDPYILEIISSYQDQRIKIFKNQLNMGLTKSLNIGLRMASGKYIARIDADDFSYPERLEKQYNYMEGNASIALVGSWVKIIDGRGKIFSEKILNTNPDFIRYDLIFGKPPMFHSSIFFRKDVVDSIGGYDERYEYSQDFDLYLRLLEKNYISNIPEFLVEYRSHSHSITKSKQDKQHQCYLKSLYQHINDNYIKVDYQVFTCFIKSKNQEVKSLKSLIQSMVFLTKLHNIYLKKHGISGGDKSRLIKLYHYRIRLICRWYVKHRFNKPYTLLKNIYKNKTFYV